VRSSLNHPNIAALYGMEESEGKNFLVMELVEGDTLAERMQRGPIPVEEALEIAKQIAEALEAAHEKGVIHRDLKPANVKITPERKVKVLDFGLAKAIAVLGCGVARRRGHSWSRRLDSEAHASPRAATRQPHSDRIVAR